MLSSPTCQYQLIRKDLDIDFDSNHTHRIVSLLSIQSSVLISKQRKLKCDRQQRRHVLYNQQQQQQQQQQQHYRYNSYYYNNFYSYLYNIVSVTVFCCCYYYNVHIDNSNNRMFTSINAFQFQHKYQNQYRYKYQQQQNLQFEQQQQKLQNPYFQQQRSQQKRQQRIAAIVAFVLASSSKSSSIEIDTTTTATTTTGTTATATATATTTTSVNFNTFMDSGTEINTSKTSNKQPKYELQKRFVLYNSRTRQKELFKSQEQLQQERNQHQDQDQQQDEQQQQQDDTTNNTKNYKILMYTCGPTVYDYAHVGNFRAFLTYDIIKRLLLYIGYTVIHVCNITNVDDKIIIRANEQNISIGNIYKQLTIKYEKLFLYNLQQLNCIYANYYPKATNHILQIQYIIKQLSLINLAYETFDGSWYFNTQQTGITSTSTSTTESTSSTESDSNPSAMYLYGQYGTQLSTVAQNFQNMQSDIERNNVGSTSTTTGSSTTSLTSTLSETDTSNDKGNVNGNEVISKSSTTTTSTGGTGTTTLEQGKKHFADFALWKAAKAGIDRDDMLWDDLTISGTTNDSNTNSDNNSIIIKKGRPGWHIECSAMSYYYFGTQTLDFHGGGQDLMFPHHENEIAQSEGLYNIHHYTNKININSNNDNNENNSIDEYKLYCNCWFHNGFVNIGNEKMSKSLNNFITLNNACTTHLEIRAYRYLVITSHYRNPLTFTAQVLQASKNTLVRIDKIITSIQQLLLLSNDIKELDTSSTTISTNNNSTLITKIIPSVLNDFHNAILDDLMMPRAAAAFFTLIKALEKEIKLYNIQTQQAQEQQVQQQSSSSRTAVDGVVVVAVEVEKDTTISTSSSISVQIDIPGIRAAYDAILQMDEIFGILYTVPASNTTTNLDDANKDGMDVLKSTNNDNTNTDTSIIPEEVTQLVQQRTIAKDNKEWDLADTIRTKVLNLGYTIKDVKNGEPIISFIEK